MKCTKIIKFKNLVVEHEKIPLGTLKLWKLELMEIMEVYYF